MIAYFLGGSWDLTKRHMKDCPPVYEVISVPRASMKVPTSPADMDMLATLKIEREHYVRARHDHEQDGVVIYMFEDWP